MAAFSRFGVFAACLVMLAGCAVTHPLPAPTASSSTVPSSAAAAPATGSAEDALWAEGDSPRVLDAELLGTLLVGVESRSSSSPRIFASWPQFGYPTVGQPIAGYFSNTINSFEEAFRKDRGSAAELNMGWQLLASSPSVVGIVSDSYLLGRGPAANRWRSFWLDPASGTVLGVDALIDRAATLAALRSVASARSGIELDKAGADPVLAAPLLAFTPAGELLLGFDQCQVADCARGRITLTIPRTTTDRLLTEDGRSARAATVAPTDHTAPTAPTLATPPPTPDTAQPSTTPSPTSTGTKLDCRKVKCVALTFDDGPAPTTQKLLRYLADKRVQATFFMLGQQVETYPKLAKAVASASNEIGVHTWDHRDLTKLNPQQIDREITSTIRILKEAGITPRYLRPPYGAMNAKVHAAAKRAGLPMVLWNVDTLDWQTRSTEKTVAAALKGTRRGSIILVHDIHKWSIEAIPSIIDGLRAKGYTFVTVSTLLGKTKPGHKYDHG